MTEPNLTVTEADLHAFADGRLAPVDHVRVETWLASNPAEAAKVAAWRAQK